MRNLHLGTIGWSYSFWKGSFYPQKQPANKFLAYYASQFNSVEVDSTFYRIPNQQTVINWKKQTPADFMFSLKFPKNITHIKMLINCQEETDLIINRAKLLEEKLGPLLLQFPPGFGTDHLPELADFLHKLPKPHRYVVEIRNKSFLNEEFYSLLRANKIALAWADSSLMSSIAEVTSDFLYIRWEGDRKKVKGTLGKIEADKQEDLKRWAEKLDPFIHKGMEVFGYFGKYYSGFPPYDAKVLPNLLGNKLLPN